MRLMVSRTMALMSTQVRVVISPVMMAMPVVTRVSAATRPYLSAPRMASRMESEIWSATLSGCPSVTDSEVNRCGLIAFMHCLPCCWSMGKAGT